MMKPLTPGGPSEFDVARKRAEGQAKKQQQTMQDAIKRRAASLGNLNSGAVIKQQQQAIRDTGQQLRQATEGIDAAERSDIQRRRDIQEQRDFARGEREATQSFQAEQAGLTRTAQQSQFEKTFGLQSKQFEQQKTQWSENLAFQKQQLAQQHQQFVEELNLREGMNAKQTKMAEQAANLAMEQWDFQKKTEAFNAIQSLANQKLSKPQVDAMIGILGSDIMNLFQNDLGALFGTGGQPAAPAPAPAPGAPQPTGNVFGGIRYDPATGTYVRG